MGKAGKAKKKGGGDAKALAKLAKKQKQEKKLASKETKKVKSSKAKSKEDTMDEADFIASLEEHRLKWAAEHAVSGKSGLREV